MKRLYFFIAAVLCVFSVTAAKYNYTFNKVNIPEALTAIAEQHPDIHINFIYDELDRYNTSATINTDNIYEVLRQIVGFNPVSIMGNGNYFFIEALQHGRYEFSGYVTGEGNEPVAGASVMILTPRDSTVITYGVTDDKGYFLIPCDKRKILMKFSCVGYGNTYLDMPGFSVGHVKMSRLPVELSAVTVEADNTILSTDKNTYIPSVRQKNASQDAIDLLRRMAIPQLVINPIGNSVKDVFGNNVPVYVNYHIAEGFDLQGMKMNDVRKIEYYEYPSDPRFKGADKVVNIIVQEYEYGGYTKVSQAIEAMNGLDNNSAIFSKFTYKQMTYDAFVGSQNKDYHHSGVDELEQYHLENNGDPMTVCRDEILKDSHNRTNEFPVTFRATYKLHKFSTRNSLSFTHFSAPEQSTGGELKVNLYPEKDYSYLRSTPNRHNYVYYHGNFQGSIGKNMSFDINPSFNHTHRNNISSYNSSMMSSPITNYITENTYCWGIQATSRLLVKQKHQLILSFSGSRNIYKLTYRGNNNADDAYYDNYIGSLLKYRFQSRRYSFSTYVELGYSHNSMNDTITCELSPAAGVNATISINRRNQISGSFSFGSWSPSISLKANDIVQSNEFMYLTGNPNLKNWRDLKSNIAYNYYYNNSFSFAAFAGYDQQINRVATIYRPFDDGKAIIRDFINNGRYDNGYFGIQVNYKLFNNNLQLYGNLAQNFYNITGDYKDSYMPPVRIQLQGAYYWRSFNILASWASPQDRLSENSHFIIKKRSFYTLSLGWGNGTWTVKIAARNIFNRDWRSETWERQVPLYSEYKQMYNPSAHRSLNLSITYTVGYGKKVQRGNEIQGESSESSAIIR